MLDFSVTFLFTLINLTILYVILKKILFKPVTKFMEDRTLKVKNELEKAEKERADAEAVKLAYEELLQKANLDAERILHEARDLAQEQSREAALRAKEEAERMIANARLQIQAEKVVAAEHFKKEAAAMILLTTSHLLRREVQTEDSLRVVNDLIANLEGK